MGSEMCIRDSWGLSPLESVKMLQEKVMKEFPLGIYKDSEEEAAE